MRRAARECCAIDSRYSPLTRSHRPNFRYSPLFKASAIAFNTWQQEGSMLAAAAYYADYTPQVINCSAKALHLDGRRRATKQRPPKPWE